MTIKIRLTMSILYILISVRQWGKKEFLAIRFEGHKQVSTKIKVKNTEYFGRTVKYLKGKFCIV